MSQTEGGYTFLEEDSNCFSYVALGLYAELIVSLSEGTPIDLVLKQIKRDDHFKERDIKWIEMKYINHFNHCKPCFRKYEGYVGGLWEIVRNFEMRVKKGLGDTEKNSLFFRLRKNFLLEHLDYDDPCNLFRYLDNYFFSRAGDFHHVEGFERHISECDYCRGYKSLGHSANLVDLSVVLRRVIDNNV